MKYFYFLIFRLYNKLKDSDQLSDKMDEQGDEFKEVIQRISKAFPGETFTKDLKLIGDSVVRHYFFIPISNINKIISLSL